MKVQAVTCVHGLKTLGLGMKLWGLKGSQRWGLAFETLSLICLEGSQP